VSLRAVIAAWNEFFFKPQSPIPVALFRIFYGVVVIANLLLLRPDWFAWYGTHAWMSLSTMYKVESGMRLNLFTVIPQTDPWVEAVFWASLAAAILLTTGLFTRLSSIAVFLCLTSIHERNLFIFHSGDAFLRVAGFFLMFAPAGAAFSIDRWVRVSKGKEEPEIMPRSPWAQRMIQFELALLYFTAFWWKSMGAPWVNGTALYYVTYLAEIHRFPVPGWVQTPLLMKLGSWATLVVEFSLGVLIWFRELRYPLLVLGVLFHLYLEYWLNIPMFNWNVLCAYVLFIEPADLERTGRSIRARITHAFASSDSGASPSPA
jgi:hypothetical protein